MPSDSISQDTTGIKIIHLGPNKNKDEEVTDNSGENEERVLFPEHEVEQDSKQNISQASQNNPLNEQRSVRSYFSASTEDTTVFLGLNAQMHKEQDLYTSYNSLLRLFSKVEENEALNIFEGFSSTPQIFFRDTIQVVSPISPERSPLVTTTPEPILSFPEITLMEADFAGKYAYTIGTRIKSAFEIDGDTDAIEVELEAGVSYFIMLAGAETLSGSIWDPFIGSIEFSDGSSYTEGAITINHIDDLNYSLNAGAILTPDITDTYSFALENLDETAGTYSFHIVEAGLNIDYVGSTDQIINGTSTTDVIVTDEGNDIIYGGAGDDYMASETGNNTFIIESIGYIDYIDGFEVTKDKLDISDVLTSYDPVSDAIADFVRVTSIDEGVMLSVDIDGGADNFVDLVALIYNSVFDITTAESDYIITS